MRIGLITDTHIPDVATELPRQVFDVFQGVDLILHAGDVYSIAVLDELERVAPVKAALGDDDAYNPAKDARVSIRHVLQSEGYTIWLTHEEPRLDWPPIWQSVAPPDVIVHGHTHEAEIRESDGILFVGSGSPTFLEYHRGLGTVAIMEIGPGGVQADIVRLG
jgi:putative phosphoesterase